MIHALSHHNVDAIALQELGINFSRARPDSQWKTRIGWNTWLDGNCSKTVNAWNCTLQSQHLCQWGGTAILATGPTTAYAAGAGCDPTNLGHWCWTCYRGKHDIHFRFFSIYCPNRNTTGQLSVYAQHRKYLQEHDDDCNPITALFKDLAMTIQDCIASGDIVIVCGDVNEDVLSPTITNFLQELGLCHLIFQKHDPSMASATYAQNTNRVSIDGIWGPPSLQILQGGYLDFDDFPGDHRTLWFDIPYDQLLGHNRPPSWQPQIQRLQL